MFAWGHSCAYSEWVNSEIAGYTIDSSLGFDTVEHRCVWLSSGDRIPLQRVAKRCANCARPRQQPAICRIRAILVGSNKQAAFVSREVLEGLGEFGVVNGRVESTYDSSHSRVGRKWQVEGL